MKFQISKSMYYFYFLVFMIIQVIVNAESFEVSYEFPRTMTDSDPNIVTWDLEMGESTPTKTLNCFDGTYFGPFGSAEQPSYPNVFIPNMILKKTYTNLPPHWSASFQVEMHGLWYLYNVPTTWYIDGIKQWYQVFYYNFQQMNQKIYGSAVEESFTCSNTNIRGLGTAQYHSQNDMFIIPFFNTTHTSDTLEIKIESTLKNQWYRGSFAFTDIYVHVDTCYYTCKTCNGPTIENCLTCPDNSIQIGQQCVCNTGYIASKWQCIQNTLTCEVGYQVNSQNICEKICPIEFCQSCTEGKCTVCLAGYYNLRGICVEDCPFYTTTSGQNCIDNDENNFIKPYVVCDLFTKNTITNQDFITSGFIYEPETTYNAYSDGQNYKINSRVGEKCQGKNVVGGRGPNFYILCNVLRKCKHTKTFTNLPPHYSITVRFMAYIFDTWESTDYMYVYFDDVQVFYTNFPYSTISTGVKCGKPLQHAYYLDLIEEQTITKLHSSDTFNFEVSSKLNQYNSDESFGFRDFSIILELCENPLCQTCSSAGQDCDTCKGLYRDQLNQCQCLLGYREDYPNQFDCIPCANDLCEICQSDSSVLCQVCIGAQNLPKSRITNECICPRGYYDNFQNDNLDINCLACINTRCYDCVIGTECQTCVSPTTRQGTLCNCIDGYYDKSSQEDCEKCDIGCLTCSGGGIGNCDIICQHQCLGCLVTNDGCIDCRGNREGSNCQCPDGYWENLQENCDQCHETCDGQCDKTNSNCTGCILTRILDITNPIDTTQCECDPSIPGIQDASLRTYYCTTCEYAVLDMKFSNDLSQILIEFSVNIAILDYNGFQQDVYKFQTELCFHIFEQQTIDKLGDYAECRHNPDVALLIEINLGQAPSIVPQDQILFKKNTIERQSSNCIGTTFSNFVLTEVQEPQVKNLPSLILQGPTSAVTVCYEITIQASEIVNDGGRGVFNLNWTLVSSTASTENQELVKNLLALANDKQQNYLTFPPIFLQNMSNYKITLSYKNFVNTLGQTIFSLNTLGKEGTFTEIQQTAPFLLKNYKINYFYADIRYFDCESGILEEKDKALDTFWEVEFSDNTILDLQYKQTEPQLRETSYEMLKYQYTPGNTYILRLRTEIPNGQQFQKSSNEVKFKIQISDLLVFIEGGSRSTAYSADLDIAGVAKDIDLAQEFQKDGLTYQWTCENMSDPSPLAKCTTIDGTELQMTNDTNLHFTAKSLEPYKSFLFNFEATNQSGNTGKSQAAIVIIENDLPMLMVNIPENVIAEEINKNDDLQIDIIYDGNPDNVFFSLSLFYNYDIVATKRQGYTSFSFKIWDLFDSFVGSDNEILIRISMYDPNFFMPSQSSYNVKINLPPRSGTLQITPNQGTALDTQFQIALQDYYDKNSPLSYKYHIYTNSLAYLEENQKGESPINFKKHIIKDFTNQNQLNIQLPQADLDLDTNQQDMLIMVSISDSKGAIFNTTQIIQVNKPNSSIDDQLQNLNQLINNMHNLSQIQQVDKYIIYGLQLSQMENNIKYSNCNNQGTLQEDTCTCYSNFYSLDCSMSFTQFQTFNSLKKLIYTKLESLQSLVTSQATKDQIVKIQKLLIQGDGLTTQYNDSEINTQLLTIQQIVLEKQEEIDSIVNSGMWNTGDSQITRRQIKATSILGSYIGLLDKLQLDINNDKINRRSLGQQTNELNKNLQQIQNIQQSINNALQTAILPNSDKIQFSGLSTKKIIQKSTNQIIQNDYFSDQNVMEGFNSKIEQKPFFTGSDENASQKTFKASQTVFKDNPFRLEDDYPYPNQNSSVQSIDISINEINNNDVQNIEISRPIQMSFQNNSEDPQKNVCIQKNKDKNKFESDNCKTTIIENDDSSSNLVKCECNSLTPSTVVNDLQNVFIKSNLDEVFTANGFNALAEFKFWESVIFYFFCILTGFYILGICKGYQKDKKDRLQINPIQQQKLKKIIEEQKIQQQNLNQNNSIQLDITDLKKQRNQKQVEIFKEEPKLNDKKSQKIINDIFNLDSSFESQTVQNNNFQIQKIQQINKKKMSHRKRYQKQQKLKNSIKIDSNFNILSDRENLANITQQQATDRQLSQKTISFESPKSQFINEEQNIKSKFHDLALKKNSNNLQQGSQNSDSNQEIQLSEQHSIQEIEEEKELEIIDKKLTKKAEIIQFVLMAHQLLGINYLYDPKISRPARYSIIYAKVSAVLAFSSTMANSLNQYQQILWSLVVGIMSSLPILIITKLLKTNIIGKIIGIILIIGFIGISIYIALTNAALMEIDKSNEWANTYISSMVLDYFFIQIWIGWFKLLLFNASIDMSKGLKLRKILSVHKQIQLHFADL